MDIGMLWVDNEKTTNFSMMVHNASKYYQNKYGRIPNLCFVHPSMMEKADQLTDKKIVVKPDKSVLPGLLWIGVDEKLPLGAD